MTSKTECSVLTCLDTAELMWSTGDEAGEYADWGVCRAHHLALRSGMDWATNSDGNWIVMGSDFDVREMQALEAALVSWDYTGSGKEMRIAFTTGKATFVVVLDREQVADFGRAFASMGVKTTPDLPEGT